MRRGPLPLAEALRLATEIGEALSAAHRAGIVHRDLKPSNVMLTRTGVKLLDFGLATRHPAADVNVASRSEAVTLTQPGMLVGTLRYMAPEQVECRAVDARTDIFALGAVVYEMIAGAPPFRGESPASIAAAILGTPPPALPALLRDPTCQSTAWSPPAWPVSQMNAGRAPSTWFASWNGPPAISPCQLPELLSRNDGPGDCTRRGRCSRSRCS